MRIESTGVDVSDWLYHRLRKIRTENLNLLAGSRISTPVKLRATSSENPAIALYNALAEEKRVDPLQFLDARNRSRRRATSSRTLLRKARVWGEHPKVGVASRTREG
jgi:hypothetical protein